MKNVLVTAILCMTSAGGEIASLCASPAMRRPTARLMHRDVRSMPDFLESIIGITSKSVTVSFGKASYIVRSKRSNRHVSIVATIAW
jgi:hypothetical protein